MCNDTWTTGELDDVLLPYADNFGPCSDEVGVTWPELLDSHGLTLEVHHQGDCLVLLANIDTPFLNRGLGFFSH